MVEQENIAGSTTISHRTVRGPKKERTYYRITNPRNLEHTRYGNQAKKRSHLSQTHPPKPNFAVSLVGNGTNVVSVGQLTNTGRRITSSLYVENDYDSENDLERMHRGYVCCQAE